TFVLSAGSSLPKIFKQRKEVGVRIPQGGIIAALFTHREEPLITASLPSVRAEDDEAYFYHPELIEEEWGDKVDMILDAGTGSMDRTTVVRLTDSGEVEIIREGAGELQI
ncbi:MAG: Sua5/YciO/YrdC/YwlC family protein, partial [Porphyromonas sp.]|nr:Sua5/YciO/YrdC/YwlC family protein [Porphyromonas sp.]